MQPQPNTHWDSKEFDDLIDSADATKDLTKLKQAYLLARREAPWAETAGKTLEPVQGEASPDIIDVRGATRITHGKVDLRVLRHSLELHGLLDDEDSSE